MKTFWTIVLILLGLGFLLAGYFFFFSETAKKKKLVAQIMEKGKSKPGFDASPEVLMKKSLADIKEILQAL